MLPGGKDSEAGGLSCFGNPQDETVASIPLDEVLSNIGIGWFHTRLLWLCGLGFCASAVEVVLSGFLYMELRKDWHLNEYQIGLIPTVVGAGAFVGEISWGPLADAYGRRTVFTLTCLVSFAFGMGTAFAPNLHWLIFLRCLMGSVMRASLLWTAQSSLSSIQQNIVGAHNSCFSCFGPLEGC